MTHFCNQLHSFCNSTAFLAHDLKEKGAEQLGGFAEYGRHCYEQLPSFVDMKTFANQAGEYMADILSDPRTLALICRTAAIALILYAYVDAVAREQEKALLHSDCKAARRYHKHSAAENYMTRFARGVQRGFLLGMIAFY